MWSKTTVVVSMVGGACCRKCDQRLEWRARSKDKTEAYKKLSMLNEAYEQELIRVALIRSLLRPILKKRYDCGIHAYLYIKAFLEGKEVMCIEALQREFEILRVGLAAQIICEGRELKKLGLKLDIDDPEYLC
ncbi:uncharacterized protein A4U43_C01F20050 [Asparagus officinalis]|uniref:Uncharacterized protein n=1 Tax=Asparagus officinalis TaxID=4686 RepID=A0A5P1FR03_ASPOF|nr:uncharacterized protein A4U43_C01F20050 [Asparagus officinalis]